MSELTNSIYCGDCRAKGRAITGAIVGPDGEHYCFDHARERNIPAISPRAAQVIVRVNDVATPEKRKQVDWAAAQADRNSGKFTLAELAEKYGVSTATICLRTRPAPNGKPQKKPAASAAAKGSSRNSLLAMLIQKRDELEARRTQIAEQIKALDLVIELEKREP
jgi:hypothetical protein